MRLPPLLVLLPCAALAGACGPAEGAAPRGHERRGLGVVGGEATAAPRSGGPAAAPAPALATTARAANGAAGQGAAPGAADAAALVSYAEAALALDDTAGARLHLRDAARTADDAPTTLGLARASEHLGDSAAATAGYHRYLALAPRGRDHELARARLHALGAAVPDAPAVPAADPPVTPAAPPTPPDARTPAPRTVAASGAAASAPAPPAARAGPARDAPGAGRPRRARARTFGAADARPRSTVERTTRAAAAGAVAHDSAAAAPAASRRRGSRWVRVRNWVTGRDGAGRAAGAPARSEARVRDSLPPRATPAEAPRPTVPLVP